MNLLAKIINIGVHPEYEEKINEKIKVTNFVSIFYGFLSLPFTFITFLLIPSITHIPASFFGIAIFCILLNKMGMLWASRFILSIGLISIFLWFGGSITPDGEQFITPLFSIYMIFLPIPLLVYNLDEKIQLFITTAFIAFVFFMTPYLIDQFSVAIDVETLEIFRTGWMSYLAYAVSFVAMTGSILFFSKSIFNAQKRSLELIKISEEKTKLMEENEHKLNDTLTEVQQARAEDNKRQWASEGLGRLTELMRVNNVSSKQIYDSVVSFLVKYLEVNQGGLYLIEEEEDQKPWLNLVSMYAFDRKKYMDKRFEIGQGLLGQAVLEKNYIYLTEIPADFIEITSGLGHATPSTLLLMPLKVNEDVCGVFETASFSEIAPYKIDFLMNACISIASLVSNIRITEKTKFLLEQTRQQTEEMRAQEEEMRQNMEELQSTQEEMVRKEREYLKLIQDLENKLQLTQG